MSPRPLLLILLSALAVLRAAAAPGDALADRIVLSAPSFPVSGDTAGMTIEPGEINEAASPANLQDKSVWYEWTATVFGSANFTLTVPAGNLLRGLAAYTLPAGEGPVTMARLQPAGAVVLPGDIPNGDYSLRLWTAPGQKFILRAWTGPGSSAPYQLSLSVNPRTTLRPGDTTLNPRALSPNATRIFQTLTAQDDLTSETNENRLSGQWFPAGCVQWIRWTPAATRNYHLFLTDSLGPLARIAVVAPIAAGQFDLLSTPGPSTLYTARKGEPILLRVDAPYSSHGLKLNIIPADVGDEPSAPAPLPLGKTTTIEFRDASPTVLPLPGDNPQSLPDFWFDLGSNLSGGYRITFPWVYQPRTNDQMPDAEITIYRTDSAGNILALVSGGKDTPENSFFAVPGQRYMARVLQRISDSAVFPLDLSFAALGTASLYDHRETAPPLPPDGPVHFIADSTNATAEESDWTPVIAYTPPRSRTLWFPLDRPASPEPWYVSVAGAEGLTGQVFREQNGVLTDAADPLNGTYALTGQRIWIRVIAAYQTRFILLAGPAVTLGDKFENPIPITPGTAQPYYFGGATPDTAPAPVSSLPSLWFSWSAAESGLVCFSTLGSQSYYGPPRVYTAAGELVTSSTWANQFEQGGYVISFQAVAGTSYRIAVYDYLVGTVFARIQPGGWNSPYDVWLQFFPAWAGEPTLSDPLADTDRDGITNIIEMACWTNGVVYPDSSPQPWFFDWGQSPRVGFLIYVNIRPNVLQGPPGCVPFQLTGEISTDLHTWTPIGSPGSAILSYDTVTGPGTGTPSARYFRIRVYR